jgi:hypothetical protein
VVLGLGFSELPGSVNGDAGAVEKHLPFVEFGNGDKREGMVLGSNTRKRSEHGRLL